MGEKLNEKQRKTGIAGRLYGALFSGFTKTGHILILLLLSALLFTSAAVFAQAAPVEYVQKQPLNDITAITVNVNIMGETINTAARLYNGRLYLPVSALNSLGAVALTDTNAVISSGGNEYVLPRESEKTLPNVLEIDNEAYFNAFELISCLNMVIDIDSASNTVSFYKKSQATLIAEESCFAFSSGETEYKSAYLRLEDIMADGPDTDADPKYTDRHLMYLRELADILYENNQKYYAAWIPVYVNPVSGCINNLLKNRSLYNADFLGTLDYLSSHNGRIGLHGYTHQYGWDKSAVGWEWGSKTIYSEDEQESRFVYAKNTAEMLGIDYYFFEFPHYGITDKQAAAAEKYFNVIYQKYSSADNSCIYNHNGVLWVPTPAGCINYDGYGAEAISNVKNITAKGYIYSIYYHPTLDFNKMTVETAGSEIHIFRQGYTNLYYLLDETEKLGYSFGYFN